MDIERERGITIRSKAGPRPYTARDGRDYQFNLIDTPGHVDFTYEVSRGRSRLRGAILVVDASQGVEASPRPISLSRVDAGLEGVPCLNKIDLPGAEPERVAKEVVDLLGARPDEILRNQREDGEGVQPTCWRWSAPRCHSPPGASRPPHRLH